METCVWCRVRQTQEDHDLCVPCECEIERLSRDNEAVAQPEGQ